MSTNSSATPDPRPLPDRPNLRHLKDQAKDLLAAGGASSLTDAQFQIARQYGFASWPKLKAHVESLHEIGQLKQAIDANDLDRVKAMMTRNPALHRAPLGYGGDGPLTWVAECRVPWEPPTETRLAMARWMIENGSDVHQGGDGPLMRAALNPVRVPMMELLVSHGADVNAPWHGGYPVIFAACEAVNPVSLKWLLEHGANPNATDPRNPASETPLEYVIGSYGRSVELLAQCIDLLLEAGGRARYAEPAVLDLLRGRLDRLDERLAADPALVHRQFPDLTFGTTGGRNLMLVGATLLHVAAEYLNAEAVTLLLDRGADVNQRAAVDADGVGGQTAIFHAVTQFEDDGLPIVELLIARGADLSIRVKIPGHYEKPGEIVECTPLGYALRFMEGNEKPKTIALLRAHGAVE
jgi:ankyrin repeat protein